MTPTLIVSAPRDGAARGSQEAIITPDVDASVAAEEESAVHGLHECRRGGGCEYRSAGAILIPDSDRVRRVRVFTKAISSLPQIEGRPMQ
jgi:hypothetical protein